MRIRLRDVRSGLTVTFRSALNSRLGTKISASADWSLDPDMSARPLGRPGSRSVTITFAVRQSTLWHDLMTKLRLTARLAIEGLAIMNNHCVIRSHF